MNTEQSNKNYCETKGQILVKTGKELHTRNSAKHRLRPSATIRGLWNLTGKQLVTVLNRLQIDTNRVNLGFTLPAPVQRFVSQLRHQVQPGHTSRAELGGRVREPACPAGWTPSRRGAGSGIPLPVATTLQGFHSPRNILRKTSPYGNTISYYYSQKDIHKG